MDKGLDARLQPNPSTATESEPVGAGAACAERPSVLHAPKRLLSTACLEWLADGHFFAPKLGSPLEFLRASKRRFSGSERQQAGARLLNLDPWTHRPLLAQRLRFSPLGQALAVLEAPEARLRIALGLPGRPPTVVQYFAKGRLAVAADLDSEGLRVAEPVRVTELLQQVVAELDSSALPAAMEAVAVLPEVFELLNALWGPGGRKVSEPITRDDLVNRLGGSTDARLQACSLLTAMVTAELLVQREEAYFLVARLASWLDRVWSGHVLEVERQALTSGEPEGSGGGESGEGLSGLEHRLIFVGPPGERILCEDLITGARQSVVLLSRPGSWELGDRLRRLFGGVSQSVRSFFDAGETELGGSLSWGGVLPVH